MPKKNKKRPRGWLQRDVNLAIRELPGPLTVGQVREFIRNRTGGSFKQEKSIGPYLSQAAQRGEIRALPEKTTCPVVGALRKAYERVNGRPVPLRKRATPPAERLITAENWTSNLDTVMEYVTYALNSRLALDTRKSCKNGRAAAPAVLSAILATTDFERKECAASRTQLAGLVGVDEVTVTGSLGILEASRVIQYQRSATRFGLAGDDLRLVVPVQRSLHPFEALLDRSFREDRFRRIVGTPVVLLMAIAKKAEYGPREVRVTLRELREATGFTDHTVLSGLEKLTNEKFIKRQSGSESARPIRLLLEPQNTNGHADVKAESPFIELLKRRVSAGDLKHNGKSKTHALTLTAFLAVAVYQRFGLRDDAPTCEDIERKLGGGLTRNRRDLNSAVDLGLIKVSRCASRAKTIMLLPPEQANLVGPIGDPGLVLSLMVAWRHGLIARIGYIAHRTLVTCLRLGNFSSEPFMASVRDIERAEGRIPAGVSTSIKALQDFPLVRSTGTRKSTQHRVLHPLPDVKNGSWQREQKCVDTACREALQQAGDYRERCCATVAALIRDVAQEQSSLHRIDLLAFLVIAVESNFDSEHWVMSAAQVLRAADIRDPTATLPRLANAGYLIVEHMGNKGTRCRVQYDRAMEIWVAPGHVRVTTAIIERIVKSGVVARMDRAAFWLYCVMALRAGCRFGEVRAVQIQTLAAMSGLDAAGVGSTTLPQLVDAKLLSRSICDGQQLLSLIDATDTGTSWPASMPSVRRRKARTGDDQTTQDGSTVPQQGQGEVGSIEETVAVPAANESEEVGGPKGKSGLIDDRRLPDDASEDTGPTLADLDDPVQTALVADAIGRAAGRRDYLGPSMRRDGTRIVKSRNRLYCERADAIRRFPRYRARIESL